MTNVDAIRSIHSDADGSLAWDLLFALLADDVAWHVAGSPDLLPWAGVVHGHEGVRHWLATLNEHMSYDRFELGEIHGEGDTVIELVHASGRAAASGRPFASDVVRIWTFRDGKAVRVRSYYDTAAYERAFLGGTD